MTQGKTIVRNGGRSSDLDQPHIDASVELRNIPLGPISGSGQPTTLYLEQRIDTLIRHIEQLEQLVYGMSQQLQSLATGGSEETPELFDLPPVSERHAVGKVEGDHDPAHFYFVEDDYEVDTEDAEH